MATIKTPIRIGDDTPLRNFQTDEAVGPDHGGTGLVTSDLAGQAGKVLTVNGTEDGWTLATGGGGGGGSDALGTGFTSGGGGGSIPAETVAQMQGRFDIDNQDANILRIGDVNGVGSNLRLEISPDGITLGDGDYVFGAIPGDDIMTLTSPGGIFFAGATGLEAYVKEAANSGFKITDNQVVKTGAYYAGDYSATLATNDRSIPDVGTVKIIIQSGPPQYTTTQRDALSPSAGWTIYCTDATANDTSTGVMQTYNGSTWKNHW